MNVIACVQKGDTGDFAASYQLGCFYREGSHGFPQDNAKAFKYFTQAAKGPSFAAKDNLARFYMNGEVVPRDWKKAIELLKEAAAMPLAHGPALNLGAIYENGVPGEIKVDYNEALKWYRVSSAITHGPNFHNDSGRPMPADVAIARVEKVMRGEAPPSTNDIQKWAKIGAPTLKSATPTGPSFGLPKDTKM